MHCSAQSTLTQSASLLGAAASAIQLSYPDEPPAEVLLRHTPVIVPSKEPQHVAPEPTPRVPSYSVSFARTRHAAAHWESLLELWPGVPGSSEDIHSSKTEPAARPSSRAPAGLRALWRHESIEGGYTD